MSPFLVGLLALVGVVVLFFVRAVRRSGPLRLSHGELARAATVHRVTPEDPGEGWAELGSRTTARGLDLRFDHDDDPEARACLLVPERSRTASRARLAQGRAVRLGEEFSEEDVHNAGWVFRLRLRGTGRAVGRAVKIRMSVGNDGRPWGGMVENDDDDDPAVGGWIEVAWAEVLQAPRTG